MVVPDSAGVVQQADNGVSGSISARPAFDTERELSGVELEEVRKLQELVRRLEVQNQTLRNRGGKALHAGANSNLMAGGNINGRTLCGGATRSPLRSEDGSGGNVELSPARDSSSGEDMSPLPEPDRLEDEEEEDALSAGGPNPTRGDSLDECDRETSGRSNPGVEPSALDEVDELDLDGCGGAEDEDSWLYVSPKKQAAAEQRPESPLKWCRRVLDHPSPETEVACRTLLNRLDQTMRWRNIYSSPTQCSLGSTAEGGSSGPALSPGYHKSTNKTVLTCGSSGYAGARSALSSQSSVDSELSTSDDSISMGYKLQDLTDVQIMARLQEESLRQDYASSSASVSRRSSAASVQSLRGRGGAYSDQEFDARSLEDEEDDCAALPQRLQRYSPSPLGSPRCQSPGAPAGPQRARAPRRSLQGPGPELLKFARNEEELRHSMPNLAPRTSLRSLEAVRNSRSMEANLQSSGNRLSRLPHSPITGASSTRIRANGQSPLSLRAPVKALGPVGSMTGIRPPSRGPPVAQGGPPGGLRRAQSPAPANGGVYSVGRPSTGGGKQAVGRGPGGAPLASRGRAAQPPRRSLGMTRACGPVRDETWKDGCY